MKRLLAVLAFSVLSVSGYSQCFITAFNASISACDPATDTYSTTGSVSFINPPAGGSLIVEDCDGIQQVFPPPFISPIAYNLTGQDADGGPCDVTVYFTADPACDATIPYTAPECPCNMDFFSVDIGICDPWTDTYPISGDIEFTSPPATGTLVVTVDNGTTTYDTIITLPFTSPTTYSFWEEIPADGAASSITVYFSDDPGCSQTIFFTAPESCECNAEIGTFTYDYGSSPTPGVLCWGDVLTFTSNDDYTVPDPSSAVFPSYDPGVGWLIYSCCPTIGLVPSLDPDEEVPDDPCLLGIISAEDITDTDDPGIISSFPPGTFTDYTVYYVPITMYSLVDGFYSSTDNPWPCYEMGPCTPVQYTPEFTFSFTEDCTTGEATVTLNGGVPEIDGSDFTLSGLTPAGASFSTVTVPHGGTVIISGLTGGDMWSFTVTDDNGCTYTVDGGPFPPLGDPGTDGTLDVCDTDPASNLFDELGGTPDAGGTWTGPSVLGGGALGTFNPATMAGGVYTYTAGVAPCTDQATITVTVTPMADPGTPGTIDYCDTDAPSNLFNELGGTPDAGGTWAGPSVLGGADLGTFDPATMTAGVYTYSVGTAPCDGSATVTVTVTPVPDPGTDGAISFCSTDPAADLFNELGGTPAAGGTWSGPSVLGGGASGSFNPATMIAGTYTYTVGTPPCDASADVVVTVIVSADAGTDGATTLCVADPSVNLFTLLGGAPDAGGTWAGPSVLGGADLGTFDPATMLGGVYTYTVGTPPCDDAATVTVTITPLPDPGTDGAISLCSSDPVVNLFGELGGTPDGGGSWTGPSALGGGSSGSFNPATMAAGTYTYTVGVAPCTASADVVVTVTPSGYAGTDGAISLCVFDAPVDLFTILGGGPDAGGTWAGPSVLGGGGLGTFDPGTMTAGVYTYTAGTAPCDDDATVTVTITPGPDPGTDAVVDVCDTDPSMNIFDALGGTPDAGGTWAGPSALGGADLGTFDPATMAGGVYTYTVGVVPCDGSATVTVNVTPTADAGTDGAVSMCQEDGPVDLFTILGGAPDAGGTWAGPSALGGADAGTFDPSTMAEGVYTYSVGTAPCDDDATVTVTFFPKPIITAMPNGQVCEGDVLNPGSFTADVAGCNFAWTNTTGTDVGFGLAGVGNIGPFTGINGTGSTITVTIEVIATSPDGCVSDPITFQIAVHPLPVVSFTGDPLQGCEPHTVNFINTTVPTGSICVWEFGDGTTASGCETVSHVYSAGTYDVTLTVTTDAGCTSFVTYDDYVSVAQLPEASFNADPTILNVEDTEVDFDNTSLYADEYVWDFGDGSPTSSVTNPSHLYPEVPQNYTVELIAYNNDGACSDTAWAYIIIEDVILFYVPNVFTPDHDDYNETFQPVFTSGFDPYDWHMMIFNRWGELIFESYDANKGWDGTYGDRGLVKDGVYVWKIVFKESMSDKLHKHYGHVTILK